MRFPFNTAQTISVFSMVGVSLALLSGCGPQKPQAAEKLALRKVEVAKVFSGPAHPLIEATAVGAFRDEAKLSFKVAGVVSDITVREGQSVRKGQKLAWLDKRDVNAALSQAKAALDKANRDLARGEKLRAQEVISAVQLENLRTAQQVAKATYAQASYANQTAEIDAPSDALIMRRFAQPGEVVAAGQPILMLGSQASGFVMKASLSARQAVQIKLDAKATVQFQAWPNVQWQGKVLELSQSADPVTGSYGVQISIKTDEHPNNTLLSGMQGKVFIEPADYQQSRSYVPLSAIVEGDDQAAWLYLLEPNNTVKRTAVKVAFVDGDKLGLATALPIGTPVVSVGAAYLTDGQTVQVMGNAP